MLKLVTAVEFQSGLSVPLKSQGVCCSTDCPLEIREMLGLYLHVTHLVLVGLSLVGMEAPGISFHPRLQKESGASFALWEKQKSLKNLWIK